ncbi:MAG: capsule assembly Wzi family protein, partial [Calditrichota bacterium]
ASDAPHAIYYTFIHGWLESHLPEDTLYVNPDGRPRTLNAQKYLSAQRLEVRPRDNLLLGLSQGVIYGDRGVQLAYLTPVNFLYSVQHSQDDKDNFLLGFDGTWRPIRGLKLYGEALFDDIVVGDLTTSSGNNKSAYTVGFQGIIPADILRQFDATLEYTKIRPFVYTHFFASNIYTHWTSPLGYSQEPNSDYFTAQLRYTFYPVQASIMASRQRHGSNADGRNAGGDIYLPSYDGNSAIYPFLAGKLNKTSRFGVALNVELLPNLNLFGSGQVVKATNTSERFETNFGFGWNL